MHALVIGHVEALCLELLFWSNQTDKAIMKHPGRASYFYQKKKVLLPIRNPLAPWGTGIACSMDMFFMPWIRYHALLVTQKSGQKNGIDTI